MKKIKTAREAIKRNEKELENIIISAQAVLSVAHRFKQQGGGVDLWELYNCQDVVAILEEGEIYSTYASDGIRYHVCGKYLDEDTAKSRDYVCSCPICQELRMLSRRYLRAEKRTFDIEKKFSIEALYS